MSDSPPAPDRQGPDGARQAGPLGSPPGDAPALGGRFPRLLPALIALAAVLLAGIGVRWLVHRIRYVESDDAQVKSELVLVAVRHAGTIVELPIAEGREVKRGELVARLDAAGEAAEYERAGAARERAAAEYERAKAELTLIRAQVLGRKDAAATGVEQSREGLEQAREELRLQQDLARRGIERAEAAHRALEARSARARAEQDDAARNAARVRDLFEKGVVAEADRDNAELLLAGAQERHREGVEEVAGGLALLERARAELRLVEIKRRQELIAGGSLERARVDLRLAGEEQARIAAQEYGLKVLEAGLRQAEAAERAARLRLEECTVLSPVAGVVARKIADLGETLAPGQPVAVITDLRRLWIEANIKETALRRVRPGALVAVRIDALPGRTLRGRVGSINAAANSQYALLPSGNPSGQFIKVTQRVGVRIELEEGDPLLRPGMMAVVDITVP